jgi:membrane-associated phospholipid phosphatase
MPNNIALDENDQAGNIAAPVKQLRIQVARHVSNILSPAVVSVPLVFLIAFYPAPTQPTALVYALVTLFFLSIGPLLYIIIGIRLGKFTDIDVSVRTQRTGPFLFGMGSALVGLLILMRTSGPKNLETLLLITILSGTILMIITLWWKISLHASTIAGAVTILTALYGTIILPAYLLVALVSWSRVVLRRHTTVQVIAGAALSIVLTTLILVIRKV